jgi:hypothetical protein
MKRLVAIFFLLALLACSRNEPAKYALVYGISDYPYFGIDLPYSAADARSVALLLQSFGYIVTLRVDSAATMQNLDADFASLAASMGNNDLFLFYFSGHGLSSLTMHDFGDSTVQADYFSFLLHHSFSYSNLLEYIASNGVTSAYLSSLLASIPSGIKVTVLDACYSGQVLPAPVVVDHTPADYVGDTIEPPAYYSILKEAAHIYKEYILSGSANLSDGIIITSSGPAEISWDGFFGHSVFSYFFLKSAELGDIDGDGCVTSLEAYAFARAAMGKYWNSSNQTADWNFLPHITGGAADVVLFEHTTSVGSSLLSP